MTPSRLAPALLSLAALSLATSAGAQPVRHRAHAPAAQTPAPAATTPETNVSGDSAPDWAPSPTQQHEAAAAAAAWFAAIDAGKFAKAYDLTSPLTRRAVPLNKFVADHKAVRDQTGAVVKRVTNKMTFTKDPDSAPVKGIYVSVDFSTRFARADRGCGYVVLYQKRAGLPFQVMRSENNFLTNDKAKAIAAAAAAEPPQKTGRFFGKKDVQTPDTPDKVWARIAENCPNYTPVP